MDTICSPDSAAHVEAILPAFNNQLDIRIAYTWGKEQPSLYGVDPSIVTELCEIRDDIQNLSFPDGANFKSPGLEPDQCILRTINSAWTKTTTSTITQQEPNNISKFHLQTKCYKNLPYWSLYDLIGLFISLIGPGPVGATKRNFYLPLTVMYSEWCSRIGFRVPYMFHCCWSIAKSINDTGLESKLKPAPARFSLGASLGGCGKAVTQTGTWYSICQLARFSLVNRDSHLRLAGWSFGDSPALREIKRKIPFGNCTETYPFLRLLRGHNPETERVYGITINRRAIQSDQYEDGLSGAAWTRAEDPCLNCKELIRLYQGNVENFLKYAGCERAPP